MGDSEDMHVCWLESARPSANAVESISMYCRDHSLQCVRYADAASVQRSAPSDAIVVLNLTGSSAATMPVSLLISQYRTMVLVDEPPGADWVAELIRLGCVALITCPWKQDELQRALDCVLRHERYVSSDISATLKINDTRWKVSHRLPAVLAHLSVRERQVMRRLINGQSVERVYNSTLLTRKEVDLLIERVTSSCGVRGLAGLVKLAVSCGLTDLDT